MNTELKNKEVSKEVSKKVEIKKVKGYKTQYELTDLEIRKFDKLKVNLLKNYNKRYNQTQYKIEIVYGTSILTDKRFNDQHFALALSQNGYSEEQIMKARNVSITCPYRLVSGLRRDNGERFYGMDLFISDSYRPRVFFSNLQLETFKALGKVLNYEEVESDGSEVLESFIE
ncbi:MAG TPA: hypothetical protein GX708_04330 [Gallicola sp.]|nr:hypothetical protein [Gallicola sp.]